MKPKHYAGAVDPIALMQAQFTPEMLYGFYAGNVIKYVSRAHKKNGVDDLSKAHDYLERLIIVEGLKLRDEIDRETGDGPDPRPMDDPDALREALDRSVLAS